jgi:plasmid stabilization system protein ParE
MRVVFAPSAREEILEATTYYRDRSNAVVERFSSEIASTVDLLLQFPGVGSPTSRNARRLILRNFPYQLIYRVEGDDIRVYAVAHLKRRPRYWRERLR